MNNEFVYYDEQHMVSPQGIIMNKWGEILEPYISSTNMLYSPYTFDGNITRFKRLDWIVALTFVPMPDHLIELPLTVRHIGNDPSNVNSYNLEWIEDIEEWKTVDSLYGYYISSWGRIFSPHNGIIKGTMREGYLALTINNNPGSGEPRTVYQLHRLVALLFIGDITNKAVNHIDGLRDNPRWDNLEIISWADNNRHAILSGMHSNKINFEIGKLLDRLLIEHDGSPIAVVNHMKNLGFNNITEAVVSSRKTKLISMGYSFKVKYEVKLNDPTVVDLIRLCLIKYNGDTVKVYEAIHDSYPNISRKNIYTIRAIMKNEGYEFTNYKLNRKISEDMIAELIQLLREHDMSPSKTIKFISDNEKYNNVTVYDLKYLKRKYLFKT